MKKIVVIGSLNMDFLMNVSQRPAVGETVLGESLLLSPGGKGANQAYGAAILGGQVTMLGAIGEDSFGESLIANLRQAGVDTRYLKVIPKVSTGSAFITVSAEGDNSIIVIQGANQLVDRTYIDSVSDAINASDIVILQLEIPLDTVIYAARLAKKYKKLLILDPAPARPLPEELLQIIDIIKPNQYELMKLIGKEGQPCIPEAHMRELQQKGVGQVIVTLGGEGCCFLDKEGRLRKLPAPLTEAVDTTGAGDFFTAAMAFGLSTGMELSESLILANQAAAISVSRKGAQASYPNKEELQI